MKRVFAVLLCLVLMLCMFVACDEETPDTGDTGNSGNDTPKTEHTHTFKTNADWTHDANSHWYEATCGCDDVEVTKLAHTDANNDGACDVCAYTNHEHEYSEDWTADCTNHWHAADCGHTVAGVDVGAHVDAIADGRCDVCNYIIEDLHEHYYSSEWTGDAEYHWHAALCEHGVEVADKAAHTLNDAGDCTVCGKKVKEIDKTDILAVLKAALANNHKVVVGNVIAKEEVFDGSKNAYVLSVGKTNEIYFVVGKDTTHVSYGSYNKNGEFTGVDKYWYELLENNEVFAIKMPYYDDQNQRNETLELYPTTGDTTSLTGYTYLPGATLSAYDDTSTLAVTLYNLYDIMLAGENVSDAVSDYDAETGKYSFSYTFFKVNTITGNVDQSSQGTGEGEKITSYYVELYNVSVEFTVNEDLIVDVADFTIETYRNLEDVDEDLVYDPETNEVTFTAGANPTVYTYSVSQYSGERTYTSPYPKATLIPTGFELFTGTAIKDPNTESVIGYENKQVLGDEITLTKKEYVRFFLGDLYPITASYAFIDTSDVEITYTNNDPDSTGVMTARDPYFSWSGGFIGFTPADNGTYTMTIRIGEVTKVITVIIAVQEVVVPEDTADTKYVEVTDTYAWADDYTFVAPESGKYTFTIPANLAFMVDGRAVADPYAPSYTAQAVEYEVELAQGATLSFTVGAATKGVYAIGIAFTAGEVDGGDGGDDFDYTTTIVAGNNTLYFSPDEITADGATRKLVVTADGTYTFIANNLFVESIFDAENNAVTKDGIKFTLTAGEYTVSFSMFANLLVEANKGYSLSVALENAEGEVPEGETNLDGTYYGYVEGNKVITVVFNTDGEFTFTFSSPYQGENTISGTYLVSDGAIKLYDEEGEEYPQMAIAMTLEDGVPATVSYNGWDYDLLAEGEEPEGAPEVDLVLGENNVTVTGDASTMTQATIISSGAGVYYITVGTNAVVEYGWGGPYLAGEKIEIVVESAGEELTLSVNSEDYSAGTVVLNVDFVAKAADDAAKDALEGAHKVGDYTVNLYREFGTGIYLAEISNADGTVCLKFTYDLTDNGDNTYTLSNLVNVPSEWTDAGVDQIDTIIGLEWVITVDPVKEALVGQYTVINGYNVSVIKENGVYYVTIVTSDWATTLYFTYEVTDNGDGTYTIDHTYSENENESVDPNAKDTILAEMEALEIVINYDKEKEDLLYSEHALGDYTASFTKIEGQYLINVYNDDYTVDLYFTYEVSNGINGQKIYTLTHFARNNESGAETATIEAIEAMQLKLGGLEGEGTDENPYVIPEAGDYVSPYAGGYTFPVFVYEVPANGFVTISSVYEALLLQYGTTSDAPNNNQGPDGTMLSVSFYALAGTKIYIKVADSACEDAVDVPFTVAFEEFTSEDPSFLAGTWNGVQSAMGGLTPYTFAFSANGTGSGSYTNWGSATPFTINYVVVKGDTVIVNITTEGWFAEEKTITLTYDQEAGTLTGEGFALEKAPLLTVGSNYKAEPQNNNDKYIYFATEAITLKLEMGALIMAGNASATYYVNGVEMGTVNAPNGFVEVSLVYGDKLTVVINSDTYSSLTVSRVYPLGSEQNPIVIDQLPYEMTHTGDEGEKYFIYTAIKDVVLEITCPEGCLISGVTGKVDGKYTVTLAAGESITLNPWANTADTSSESTYTYTITDVTPEPDEGGEEGGGEGSLTGTVVYQGTHSSGRLYQITIDYANSTMSVIRSAMAGNSLDTSSGATEVLCTLVLDGANTTYTITSGSGLSSLTFDENGAPLALRWSTHDVTNFTVVE